METYCLVNNEWKLATKKRYLVKRVVEFSRVIEARSRAEAIEYMCDHNADTRLIREIATRVK